MNAPVRLVADQDFPAEPMPENAISYPTLPYNVEVEQALLGAMIGRDAIVPEIEAICTASDFYDPLHQRIAEAIFAMSKAGLAIAPLTLKAHMDPDEGLNEVGGARYLANMVMAAPEGDARQFAHIVSDLRLRRDAMIAIWDAQEALSRAGGSVPAIMAPVVEVADRAAQRNAAKDGPAQASVTAGALIDALTKGTNDTLGEPISTGLSNLDEVLGGLYPGNLIVLGGHTGMGKSTIGTVIGRAAAEYGVHVDYFSLEMARMELVARIIADMDFDRYDPVVERPLSYSKLLKRRCSEAEIERARKMRDLLGALDLEIHDRSMTMAEIASLARAKSGKIEGRRLVVIDHLHRIRASDRYRGNRTIEIGESASQAKDLAKMLNCPVVLLSQLSRSPNDKQQKPDKPKRPSMDSLRQSGEIEEHADAVILLHRPAYYIKRPLLGPQDPEWPIYLSQHAPVKNDLEILIEKNRHGEAPVSLQCFVEIGAAAIRSSKALRTRPSLANNGMEA